MNRQFFNYETVNSKQFAYFSKDATIIISKHRTKAASNLFSATTNSELITQYKKSCKSILHDLCILAIKGPFSWILLDLALILQDLIGMCMQHSCKIFARSCKIQSDKIQENRTLTSMCKSSKILLLQHHYCWVVYQLFRLFAEYFLRFSKVNGLCFRKTINCIGGSLDCLLNNFCTYKYLP